MWNELPKKSDFFLLFGVGGAHTGVTRTSALNKIKIIWGDGVSGGSEPLPTRELRANERPIISRHRRDFRGREGRRRRRRRRAMKYFIDEEIGFWGERARERRGPNTGTELCFSLLPAPVCEGGEIESD